MTNPLRPLPRPAPGFWPTFALLAAAYTALAGPFSCSAEGQAKQAGVGYRLPAGSQVCTEDNDSRNRRCVPINLAARPFGPAGTANAPDPAELGRRYAGGPDAYPTTRQPIGLWADEQGSNIGALINWFAEQPEAYRAQWTGVPTNEEWYDLAHTQPRRGNAFYAEYWFSRLDGGRPETAHVVNEATYKGFAWRFAPEGGLERRLGLQSAPGTKGYPVYYRVEWLPGVVEPPPPPPPVPVPPPPPPEPTCTPWPESEWLAQCVRLAAKNGLTLDLTGVCEWCAPRGKPGTTLARLRSGVCEPVVCREPEPPTCERCAAINYADAECSVCPCPPELLDSFGHVHVKPGHFCNPIGVEPPPPAELCPRYRVVVTPEIVTFPRYVPGIPSTGKLEIGLELRPEGEGPCL